MNEIGFLRYHSTLIASSEFLKRVLKAMSEKHVKTCDETSLTNGLTNLVFA